MAGADAKTASDANGLLDDLKKALAERALNAEMDHHLAADESANSRDILIAVVDDLKGVLISVET